ncbi:MAG: hypothetical protein H6618_06490 [Deltaproteobacteria bacterium]|nr:hypothetical protein [Deltaproteobacteria bacterium]
MNSQSRHNKRGFFLRQDFVRPFFLGVMAFILWLLLPETQYRASRPLPDDPELMRQVPGFLFHQEDLPVFSDREKSLAQLGKQIFFDPRFSANGEISCATCHVPEKSFSDGRPTAQGLGTGARKTPALINVFAGSWFFWDGRADSLAAQALGPVEHPAEHGVSRLHIVRMIRSHYQAQFRELFPDFPEPDLSQLPQHAMPPRGEHPDVSAKIAMYTLASIDGFSIQDQLLKEADREKKPLRKVIAAATDPRPKTPEAWAAAWLAMPEELRQDINKIFQMFGEALAEYERGLLAIDSPFDRFASQIAEGASPAAALGPGFGEEELMGLRIFLGPGSCQNCHFGPTFSNQQFHNIGLPAPANNPSGFPDAGRSVGVMLAQNSPFRCETNWTSERWKKGTACDELPLLDTETLENVGAFKTPTLRNVGRRAPYGHDGRFSDLKGILKYYNELPGDPLIGHREETLEALRLSAKEMNALEAFLNSLSSPVIDSLTAQEATSPLVAKDSGQG